MSKPALLKTLKKEFDWATLTLPGEEELRRDYRSRWGDPPTANDASLDFDRDLVTASEHVCSPAWRLGQVARDVLRLCVDIDVSLGADSQPVVRLLPNEDRTGPCLFISSGVIERLWVREALFLVGRAIGQWFLPQVDVPETEDPAQRRLLRGLRRYQQISYDRAGLLCCQDVDTACRAVLKQLTGLPDEWLRINQAVWLKTRLPDEQAMMNGNGEQFSQLRLVCLQRFGASAAFAEAYSRTPADRPAESEPAEGQTRTTDSTSESRIAPEDEGHWFAALGAALLSNANDVDLSMLIPAQWLDRARQESSRHGDEWTRRQCRELGERLAERWDQEDRLGLMRSLIPVVTTSDSPDPRENQGFIQLAGNLDLDVDDVLLLAAEVVDPEFATYPFQKNQSVQVHLDGQWIRGKVETVSTAGDLRVRFAGENEVYLLNPTSDLIRPLAG